MKKIIFSFATSVILLGSLVSLPAKAANAYGPWTLDKGASYSYKQGAIWYTLCVWKRDIFDGTSGPKTGEEHRSKTIPNLSDVRGCVW